MENIFGNIYQEATIQFKRQRTYFSENSLFNMGNSLSGLSQFGAGFDLVNSSIPDTNPD